MQGAIIFLAPGLLNGSSLGKITHRNNGNWFNALAGAAAETHDEKSPAAL
jgi:hypothetical protein